MTRAAPPVVPEPLHRVLAGDAGGDRDGFTGATHARWAEVRQALREAT